MITTMSFWLCVCWNDYLSCQIEINAVRSMVLDEAGVGTYSNFCFIFFYIDSSVDFDVFRIDAAFNRYSLCEVMSVYIKGHEKKS